MWVGLPASNANCLERSFGPFDDASVFLQFTGRIRGAIPAKDKENGAKKQCAIVE
jgi:hypothetical protein